LKIRCRRLYDWCSNARTHTKHKHTAKHWNGNTNTWHNKQTERAAGEASEHIVSHIGILSTGQRAGMGRRKRNC
jgi:hypothetical protein